MFKGLSDLAGLMKQAREIQGGAAEMKDRLAALKVEGSAGGGMAVVEMSGDQRVLGVRIEPALFAGGDRELLEDLLASAINQALEKSREAAAAEMQQIAGGMGLPDLSSALSSFGLGGPTQP